MATGLLIGGTWRDGSSGERFNVIDPATEESVAEVVDGTPDDALAACEAAATAQVAWAATPPRERSEILRNCWATLISHTDELASLIVREHGKPLADARGEVAYGAEFFRWNAEETVRIRGEIALAPSGANRMIVHHPPIGVVAMITPWNFPAAMITRKLAPAIGAGNTVVIKPPKETPLTALRIAELLGEAGVPPGVVNVVPTSRSAAW
ncbi:MAG: aldehyde dehydrogenase family protein, partial [Ilumatobacteraceae bacterium]